MLSVIITISLLALSFTVVVLRKTYNIVPVHELKRQAASGNQLARELYRVVAYGVSLRIVLWLLLGLTMAGAIVMMVVSVPPLISFLAIAVLLWLAFSWLPNTRLTAVGVRTTRWLTPAVAWVLNYVDPLLRRATRPLRRRLTPAHSGLYELQDMLNLLDLQTAQADNRMSPQQLNLIRQVLSFGDNKVRDVVRPRATVRSVALGDAIGPVLLDELHATGQSAFPVTKTSRGKEVVGVLHLGDIGIHSTGTVEDYATTGVTYIHENDSLASALQAFYRTKRQLFLVVDNEADYVGVLLLEDILTRLIDAHEERPEHNTDEDRQAVAARYSSDRLAESDETVVE